MKTSGTMTAKKNYAGLTRHEIIIFQPFTGAMLNYCPGTKS